MWTDPITDRALADVTGRTAKGLFNVSDWVRINGNTAEVNAQVASLLGLDVTLLTLTTPTMSVFPKASEINNLIENIERVRLGACLPLAVGLKVLPYNWQPGNGAPAPDYEDANDWERNLSLLHTLIPTASDYAVPCGVAETGQPRFWQHRFR